MEKKMFTIKEIMQEGGSIKIFTLSPDDAKNIPFKPGQFAMIYQLDESGQFGKLSRPYSIASSPLDNELRFAIKITGGQFTSLLDKMQVGEKLGVAGPFGHFAYGEEEKILCMAVGAGLAPLLGSLEYIAQKKKQGKFTLFYSNKKQEWIGCKGLLEKLQSANPDIKVVYTLTQEQPQGWNGELGRINDGMIRKYADYASEAAIFICGPMEFAKSMKETALRLGADGKKIRIEAWG